MVTKRDPEGARGRILAAAARAFAAHGPEGARVDAIAAQAGVNKRMLYHYFGDKQALFAAVVDDRMRCGPGLVSVAEILSSGAALDTEHLRLMVWAAIAGLEPGPEAAASWTKLVAELATEQAAGRLRGDVAARTLAVLLVGVAALQGLMPGCVRMLMDGEGLAWADLRKVLTPPTAARFVARGTRPRVRMLPEVRGR